MLPTEGRLRLQVTCRTHVLGGKGKIELVLNVANGGEDAHQAVVTVRLPPRVYYDGFNVTKPTGNIDCFPTQSSKTRFFCCELSTNI